jgi:predicted acyl esterase
MTLQVAIPKYPWTDLAYSLAPNGHPTNTDIYESSQGEALPDPNSNNADSNPFGVPKASYVAVFFGEGVGPKGDFENDANPDSREVQQDGPISLEAWMARASKDPYNEDPNGDLLMKQIRRGLTIFRSSYYQAPGWAYEKAHGNEVAIFSISGWTDALFPPVESFRQFLYLKSSAVDPMWPVSLAVADVGHPPAENKPETWHRLNVQAWQFLQSNINGAHRQMTTVYSEATVCANGSDPNVSAADQLTATSPQALSAGQLSVGYSGGDTFSDISGAGDLDSAATDPIVNFVVEPSPHCPQSVTPSSFGRYSGTSDPLTQNLTYVGLGQISIPYTGWTDTELQLDARVYDVAPDGSALLITRGTYRMAANYDVPGAGTVTLPLFGNEYPLDPGHRVRIDLAEQDYPYLLPNTSTGATPNITIAAPTLTLPLRQAVQLQMTGTQTSG